MEREGQKDMKTENVYLDTTNDSERQRLSERVAESER
jgi:hypothetical protein